MFVDVKIVVTASTGSTVPSQGAVPLIKKVNDSKVVQPLIYIGPRLHGLAKALFAGLFQVGDKSNNFFSMR
jgi:hypothetical protein